jgi:hypothetical protein
MEAETPQIQVYQTTTTTPMVSKETLGTSSPSK